MENNAIAQRPMTNAPRTICAEAPTLPPYDPRRGDLRLTQHTHTLRCWPATSDTHPVVPRLNAPDTRSHITVNKEWGTVVILV